MSDIRERVEALHGAGNNCAQVTAAVTLEQYGIRDDGLDKGLRGLGGGLGCGRTCGCVLGAAAAFGTLAPGPVREAKAWAYKLDAKMLRDFEGKFVSIECAELKRPGKGPRPSCEDLMDAACHMCMALLAEAGVEPK